MTARISLDLRRTRGHRPRLQLRSSTFSGGRIMKIGRRLGGIAAAIVLVSASGAYAQNLTITNARILDGTGRVIERGAVVVRDGKIASVSATAPAAGTGRTINAAGKTVMPGLIDAHRHIVT